MVRLANQVVTEVRQRTQQEVMGHRGRKGDPLYDIRRLLLVGEERLSRSGRRRLDAALAHPQGDLYDEVACAWVAKVMAITEIPRSRSAKFPTLGCVAEFSWWLLSVGVFVLGRGRRVAGSCRL